jgi:hypothetical protein
MKYLKTVAVAVVVAILMAFAGAGTAAATVLYSGPTPLPAGYEIESSMLGSSKLTETKGEIKSTCSAGNLKATIGKTGSATETAMTLTNIGDLTWTTCSNLVETKQGGEWEIHWVAKTGNGTIKTTPMWLTVAIVGPGTCTYSTGFTTLGTITGSTTGFAIIDINVPVTRTMSSFLCPSSLTWTAEYKVTSPTPLHVTES